MVGCFCMKQFVYGIGEMSGRRGKVNSIFFFFLNWEQVKKEYILKVVGGSGTRREKDPEVWVGKSSCPVEDLWLIFSVSGDGDA